MTEARPRRAVALKNKQAGAKVGQAQPQMGIRSIWLRFVLMWLVHILSLLNLPINFAYDD